MSRCPPGPRPLLPAAAIGNPHDEELPAGWVNTGTKLKPMPMLKAHCNLGNPGQYKFLSYYPDPKPGNGAGVPSEAEAYNMHYGIK